MQGENDRIDARDHTGKDADGPAAEHQPIDEGQPAEPQSGGSVTGELGADGSDAGEPVVGGPAVDAPVAELTAAEQQEAGDSASVDLPAGDLPAEAPQAGKPAAPESLAAAAVLPTDESTSAPESSGAEAPSAVEQIPAESGPVEPAPVEPAPVEPAPVEPTPAESASAGSAAPPETPAAAEPPAAGQLPVYAPQPLSGPPTPDAATPAPFVPYPAPPVNVEPVLRGEADRRQAWLVGVFTVILAIMVAVGMYVGLDAIEESGETAAPAATRSSALAMLTPEEYQRMLASADAAIAAPFGRFATAPGPAALDSTATSLAMAIDAETDKLSAVRPPAAATQAHQLLVNGLSRLQWEPSGVDIEGRVDGASCTGPAGAASVARTTPAGLVRTAAEQLKAVDARYVFGTFLPAPTELLTRQMANGTYLKRTSTNGSGLLKVNNKGSKDTAVSLVLAGETAPRLTVYVHAKSSFTARGITDGSYQVFTTAGVDWDSNMRVFSRDCEFMKFTKPLEFKTNGGTYIEWTVTLSPTESGNVSVEDVDAESYPTG